MPFRKLTIPNARGIALGARLDLPDHARPATAFALFAHCFTCTKNLKAVGNIAEALTQHGLGVLRFDFTGLGESEGDFADTNFSTNVDDLVAAADFLANEYEAPQLLVGHSLGGAAVLQAAGRIPSAKAVATIGAPSDPSHVLHLLGDACETIEREGEAEVCLAGRPFKIKKQFVDDLETTRMDGHIAGLKRALLICHAPFDNTVGIENAEHIFTTARHPRSFLSLDEADHLLSNERDSRYAGRVIAEWAGRYVGPVASTPPASSSEDVVTEGEITEGEITEDEVTEDEVTEDEVTEDVTVTTGASGYRTDIRAGGHLLVADEPVEAGGANLGPSPYDLLSAALGACTSMTLRMYADRKGWPLESVRVRLQHEKIHAEDCSECETKSGRIDRITRVIELSGPLDEHQRARLLEIADRCPVHRTLHAEVDVRTTLANGPEAAP